MAAEESLNEKTYILQKATSDEQKSPGTNLASQLPRFVEPNSIDDVPDLVQKPSDANPTEKSSMAFATFNYVNSIIGSGVIAMPLAMYEAGIALGFLALLAVAFASDVCLILLIRAGKKVDAHSYQDLVLIALGKPMFYLQSALQFLFPFIALISYNVIVGDTLTKVLIRISGISPESVVVRREFLVVASTLLITLPLSLYRNVARLAKISLMSIVIVLFIGGAIITRTITMWDKVPKTEDAWKPFQPHLASAIGIMGFAYMCHHTSFMIYDSLFDNTDERWCKATHISIGISTVISLIYAYAGYIVFTGYVQGDIFENYCWKDDLMNICRALYCVTLLMTYPMECLIAREVIEITFFNQEKGRPILRHAILTVLIALLGMAISLSTDCLGIVLKINGIFCALPLAFILPPLCYIRTEEGSYWERSKWLAWSMVAFGAVTMIVGIVTMALQYSSASASGCSHGKQMPYCAVQNNLTFAHFHSFEMAS